MDGPYSSELIGSQAGKDHVDIERIHDKIKEPTGDKKEQDHNVSRRSDEKEIDTNDVEKAKGLSRSLSPPSSLLSSSIPDSSSGIAENNDTESNNNNPDSSCDNDRPPNMSLSREIALVLIIMSGQIITQVGVGQGLAPIHIVGEHFGVTNPGRLSWYVASYSLTVGTFIICAGRLGDMFGHKKMFILGYMWLTLWSLLAGISTYSNSIFFDICRGLQGIGPAFLLPNGLAILGRTYPPGKRKTIAFSAFGACAPSGCVIGTTFAALFAQLAQWAWAYWSLAIAGCALALGAYLIIPSSDDDITEEEMKEKFDYLGAFTGISGLVLINVAWNQGPVVGWSTPYVYILLILGALFMTAFIFVERVVQAPLIPLKEMSGSIVTTLACVACGWGTFGIWLFYLWQFLLQLRVQSPLLVAAEFSPTAISGILASTTTAYLFSRRVPTPFMMVAALCGFCIPSILLATLPVGEIYWSATFVSMIIAPFGMDISFPTATILLSEAVPKHRQGIAASLVATVVNYSISIGLGIAGTAVHYVSPGQDPHSLLRGVRTASYVGIGLSGLGIIVSLYGVYAHHRALK